MRLKNLCSVLVILAALMVWASPASAQAAANKNLAWDQGSATLATANGNTYGYFPDASTTKLILMTVTCTGATSPFTCQTPFPAFTPGTHSLQLVASNVAGDSPKSVVFSFTFVVVEVAPANLRIVLNPLTGQMWFMKIDPQTEG